MTLEFTDQEVQELREAVGSVLGRLLGELAHADNREFRQALREKYERLERIERHLASKQESAQAHA